MRSFANIHEAYREILREVWSQYDYETSPRGLPIREIVDYQFKVVNPTSAPIVTADAERNWIIADYTRKEIELYNSCSNKVEDFAKASKFWEKLANPDNTINSAYGYLIWKNKSHGNPQYELNNLTTTDQFGVGLVTPWEWAKQSLIADKNTRQAIMRFSLPEHAYRGVKDFTCTMHGNWLIRDDKLNLTIIMRSNDVVKGLAYDLPWFCSLLDRMLAELKITYPTLEKGTYTHLSHSMHAYTKDENSILRMIG